MCSWFIDIMWIQDLLSTGELGTVSLLLVWAAQSDPVLLIISPAMVSCLIHLLIYQTFWPHLSPIRIQKTLLSKKLDCQESGRGENGKISRGSVSGSSRPLWPQGMGSRSRGSKGPLVFLATLCTFSLYVTNLRIPTNAPICCTRHFSHSRPPHA